MFVAGDKVIFSAGDLATAAGCEFALLRTFDAELGLIDAPAAPPDPLLARTAALGTTHERAQLTSFGLQFRTGVVEIPRPAYRHDELRAAAAATTAALATADVVYQGTFYDGEFLGFCDFLVREQSAWAVYDTKLARHAKVPALLQLTAYADALAAEGIQPASRVHLILGDGTISSHEYADLVPVYRARRARLHRILDEKQGEIVPVQWGDDRYTACGRCAHCAPEIAARRDLLLVAGIRITQRARLIESGITTIDALAAAPAGVADLPARTFASLRSQAEIQLRQERSGTSAYDVFDADPLGALPPADDGDVFFDIEGDPLWSDPDSGEWGLEYLLGVTEAKSGTHVRFWAHDRTEERQALDAFLDYVTERRRTNPDMHVYHYAAYEKSALLRLAGRHGVGEEIVDGLLRDNVLIDLYPIVRASVRIGERSYSLKKLEPHFAGERSGDVVTATDSVAAYGNYCDLRDAGLADRAATVLAEIGDYNADDCTSTLRLRDWLLGLAARHGIAPRPPSRTTPVEDDAAGQTETALREYAGDRAVAMMAASIGYHRREQKPFWWAHFDRLTHPVDEWADTRDVFVVESARVDEKWHKLGRQRKLRRHVTLTGRFGTGTTLGPGADMYVLYDQPGPDGLEAQDACHRPTARATVRSIEVDAEFRDVVQIEELLSDSADEYDALPAALTPRNSINAAILDTAIETAAAQLCSTLPQLPTTPAVDILRRIPARTVSGSPLPRYDDDATSITAALLDLDHSYVAVQGPPGTGKTHTGAQVIAELVGRHRWRIGVVAQSHSVVEHMLDAVVRAGVDGSKVAKKDGRTEHAGWQSIETDDYPRFIANSLDGCVIGGTAWDFANPKRVAPGSLDLLVIDEAGQFALANTIAVGASARNLLLLGDPQQLPQVSQGTHPEPVDMSALGWLAGGHGALPADFGYFLERTWRMHPELCRPVSELSYDGKLRSNTEVTTARNLGGVAPGLHTVFVDHHGNSTSAPEEAKEVVRQVRSLLGKPWSEHGERARPMQQDDILVVAPYNAQVSLVRAALAKAGYDRVLVGTVDRFQGRQAPVVIVSMTASAIDDIPRGMSFLLDRNRLNVAISRGMWSAVLIRSRLLTEYLPGTPDATAQLGAFMRLSES